MPQLFPKHADTLFVIALALLAAPLILFFPLRYLIQHSSYATGVGDFVEQPVAFSHKHHVGEIGIHCVYCHNSVEKSSFAGIPTSETCIGCHAYLWKDAPILDPIRSSYTSKIPMQWNRVNNLPDYVYFNHSIHIAKGIGCESCHGRVDEMPLMYKSMAFHMQDCLECHRHPEKYVRPREEIYSFGVGPAADQAKIGPELVKQNKINTQRITECITCHR